MNEYLSKYLKLTIIPVWVEIYPIVFCLLFSSSVNFRCSLDIITFMCHAQLAMFFAEAFNKLYSILFSLGQKKQKPRFIILKTQFILKIHVLSNDFIESLRLLRWFLNLSLMTIPTKETWLPLQSNT